MTPEQKLKWAILALDAEGMETPVPEYPCPNVDELYERFTEEDGYYDVVEEARGSGVETKLPCGWSRHYESKAMAMRMPDGSWVGWTYWFGGGKHGQPESIPWMEEAYDVECQEEEKLVVVQTFSRPEEGR